MEDNESESFSFSYSDNLGKHVNVSFYADTWTEALSQFVQFLQGCGFTLDTDSVGVNARNHMLWQDNINNIVKFECE